MQSTSALNSPGTSSQGEEEKYSRKSTGRGDIGNGAGSGLAGNTILITRERDRAREMAASVEERGGVPLIFSTIETRLAVPEGEMGAFLESFSRSTWVVLTSGKGVEFLLQVLGAEYGTPLSSKHVAVVGSKTASLLEEAGVRADCIPEREDSRFLARALLKRLKKDDMVFFPRAREGRRELIEILEERGTRIASPVLYETVAPAYGRGEIEGILGSRVEYATFTSPSTFKNFIGLAGKESSSTFLKNVKIAVIGETTATCVRERGFPVSVMPEYPDVERLLDAISADILRSSPHEEG